MERALGTLFAAGLLAFGLTACAPSTEAAPDDATTPAASAAPGAEAEADAGASADELCAAGDGGGDACVITGESATGDLAFSAYEVVKLIDTTFEGTVTVDGVRELVVTNAQFGADLTVTGVDGVVIKLSQIAGSVSIADAEHATLVQNTVGGDLTCDGVPSDGDDNQVSGTDTCPTR